VVPDRSIFTLSLEAFACLGAVPVNLTMLPRGRGLPSLLSQRLALKFQRFRKVVRTVLDHARKETIWQPAALRLLRSLSIRFVP
jgi:hypothetical protein